MADLTVCGEFAVHKQIKAGVHALKVQIKSLCRERCGVHDHVAHIKPAGVVVGHKGRIKGEGVVCVRVIRRVIALMKHGLPAAGNGHFIHTVTGEIECGEVRKLPQGSIVSKIPVAAKRGEEITATAIIRKGGEIALIGNEISARRFAANVQLFLILMQVKRKFHGTHPFYMK